MRQSASVALVLILMIIGAGMFVATAVSLRSSVTTSAATLSVQPNTNSAPSISEPAQQTNPVDSSAVLSRHDSGDQGASFYRADHQGLCDGDKSAADTGY